MKKILVFMLALYVLPLIGISQNLPLSAGIPKYHLNTEDTVATSDLPIPHFTSTSFINSLTPNEVQDIAQYWDGLGDSVLFINSNYIECWQYYDSCIQVCNMVKLKMNKSDYEFYITGLLSVAYFGKGYAEMLDGNKVQSAKDINMCYSTCFLGTLGISLRYNFYGSERKNVQDYVMAIKYYKAALYLDTTNITQSDVYAGIGYSKAKLGDTYGAIKAYSKAVELKPGDGVSYFNLGLAELTVGEKDKGCNDLRKAGELGCSQAYDYIKQYCDN